jgi:ribonuclease P protein component
LSGAGHFTGEFAARRHGVYLTVLVRTRQGGQPARLGIVAGRHAVPGSVDRSFIKRTIREVFRQKRNELGSVDIVVKVRRQAARSEGGKVRRELQALLAGVR